VDPRPLPIRVDGLKIVLDLPRLSVATAVVTIH
jgi:hypothetical protein